MDDKELFSQPQGVTNDALKEKQVIEENEYYDNDNEVQKPELSYYASTVTEPPNSKERKAHFRYRSRLEIALLMLKEAQSGALKSRIQFSAYVSSHQLKKYLEFLAADDFIEYNKDNGRYYTTKKGRHLIHVYDEVFNAFRPNLNNL